MQKFVERLKRVSPEADRSTNLEWLRRLFQSMLCSVKGRDEYGYAIEGKDEVPERPQDPKWLPSYKDEGYFHQGRIESSLSTIVGLLKEANKRADQWKDDYQDLLRKYDKLHHDYKPLKYSDLCSACQMVSDTTPPGKTITLCRSGCEGKQTIESLKKELENEQEKTAYWKESYETALKELSEGDG